MDWTSLIPLLEKVGSWLGPVAATVVGGYCTTRFTQQSLDDRASREGRAARLKLLEEKAVEVIAGANRSIAGKNLVELNFVDPVIRLYFDQGVIDAYEGLWQIMADNLANSVMSEKSLRERAFVQKNMLASELKRFIHDLQKS